MFIETKVYVVEEIQGETEEGESFSVQLDLASLGMPQTETRFINVSQIQSVGELHDLEGCTIYLLNDEMQSCESMEAIMDKIKRAQIVFS